MKKLFFIICLFGSMLNTNAQFLNFGVKGGVNYNVNGDLRVFDEGDELGKFSSNEEIGFHIGLFSEIKLPLFLYIRPELVYTHTESSYENDGESTKLKMDKFDIPVLVGFRVFKFGRFFFGPNFQYVINTDLTPTEAIENFTKISSDDFIVAGQIGIGVNFGKIGADIRWETGFTGSEANFIVEEFDIDNSNIQVETDPQQFIFSIYYKFK